MSTRTESVFISYRRSTSAPLANYIRSELVTRGIPTFIDDDDRTPGPFPETLRREMEVCSVVVVVLDRDTLTSQWVQHEIQLAYDLGKPMIPVYAEGFSEPEVRPPAVFHLLLQNGVRFHTTHGTYFREAIDRLIGLLRGASPVLQPSIRAVVDLTALPTPNLPSLVGRDDQKAELVAFLHDDEVSVVAITGFGGNGKSALVDAFLNEVAPDYGGARQVFAWHFFSQEDHGSTTANSSLFWEQALRFFGFTGPLPTNELERARSLSDLLQSKRILLVLDGVEPLQNPPHVNAGHFVDKAMQSFLVSIAREGLAAGGLVIVTSRQPVVELARFRRTRTIALDALDEGSSVKLLKELDVRGSYEELRSTARDYRGHPLSLVLLGHLLVTDYQGDVMARSTAEVPGNGVEDNVGGILSYYGNAWSENEPELIIMYLVSLLRRPMQEAEFDELRTNSSIAATMRELPQTLVFRAISHLQGYGLLIPRVAAFDCHALIRSYFVNRFRRTRPDEFVQANNVLFEYFHRVPAEWQPADLDGLDPLYRAIYHGCLANRYPDALAIYWERVSRTEAFYSQKQLGAFGSDLTAIAGFFPQGWGEPVRDGLTNAQQAFLLGLVSFELAALGRLTEALQPRRSEIAIFESLQDWKMVSADQRNLVQILLPLGKLREALLAAERSVESARRIVTDQTEPSFGKGLDNSYLLVSALARKGAVLHRMGRIQEALAAFREAESEYQRPLDRINGFYHALLILDMDITDDQFDDIRDRTQASLQTAITRGNVGDEGNQNMILARAHRKQGDLDNAARLADTAIVRLREANRLDRLPYALLERASVMRIRWLANSDRRNLDQCRADIREAEELILFSRMSLYAVDQDLLMANLSVDVGDVRAARRAIVSARKGITETGYRLRLSDVAAVEERIS